MKNNIKLTLDKTRAQALKVILRAAHMQARKLEIPGMMDDIKELQLSLTQAMQIANKKGG
ncbi:MAG: hypothetical protein KAT68_19540 [Bacteroidales bacterium]|nr:hypothetical protein [Bacteroidales bacterium]